MGKKLAVELQSQGVEIVVIDQDQMRLMKPVRRAWAGFRVMPERKKLFPKLVCRM